MKKILQAFKGLFKKRQHVIYLCDPKRAGTKCSQIGCWYLNLGPCKCTSKKRWAKLDETDNPVVATDADIMNLDWFERQLL